MIIKLARLARAMVIAVAVLAAFVQVPGLNISLILVVLGLAAGFAYDKDDGALGKLILPILVLPVVGSALANIPAVGEQLSSIAKNISLGAAGAAAVVFALLILDLVRDDLVSLTK